MLVFEGVLPANLFHRICKGWFFNLESPFPRRTPFFSLQPLVCSDPTYPFSALFFDSVAKQNSGAKKSRFLRIINHKRTKYWLKTWIKQKNQEMIGVKRCLNNSPVWLVLHFLSHLPFPNITSIPSISAFPNAPLSNLAPGCAMGPWQKPQQAVFSAAYGWVVTNYHQKKGQIFRCQETGGEKNLGGTCEMFLSFNLAKQLIFAKSTMHSIIY